MTSGNTIQFDITIDANVHVDVHDGAIAAPVAFKFDFQRSNMDMASLTNDLREAMAKQILENLVNSTAAEAPKNIEDFKNHRQLIHDIYKALG